METIKQFLSISSGSGYGSGYGYGDGYGDGYGYGDGSGSGSGDGSGSGSGDGSGSGYGSGDGYGFGSGYVAGSGDGYGSGSGSGSGVKTFCGNTVYLVDGIQTILKVVHGNYAKGFLLNYDLTLTPCYVAKQGDYFAHGVTLRAAQIAVLKKAEENMSVEERIEAFWECHNITDKYLVKDFYEWHHKLTGSCKMGRDEFAKDHGINLDNGRMTVNEFVTLTESAYGGTIIKQLWEKRPNFL